MFKGAMRRGLHGRLVSRGVNPVVAMAVVEVVYPGKEPGVARPALVDKREAARIVERFVDQGSITETQMLDHLWGTNREGGGI